MNCSRVTDLARSDLRSLALQLLSSDGLSETARHVAHCFACMDRLRPQLQRLAAEDDAVRQAAGPQPDPDQVNPSSEEWISLLGATEQDAPSILRSAGHTDAEVRALLEGTPRDGGTGLELATLLSSRQAASAFLTGLPSPDVSTTGLAAAADLGEGKSLIEHVSADDRFGVSARRKGADIQVKVDARAPDLEGDELCVEAGAWAATATLRAAGMGFVEGAVVLKGEQRLGLESGSALRLSLLRRGAGGSRATPQATAAVPVEPEALVCPRPIRREAAWEQLVERGGLVAALTSLVRDQKVDDAEGAWATWRPFVEARSDDDKLRWEAGRYMVQCAGRAAEHVKNIEPGHEPDALPAQPSEEEDVAVEGGEDLVLHFTGRYARLRPVLRTETIRLLLLASDAASTSIRARLWLEWVGNGNGRLYPDPRTMAFILRDERFKDAEAAVGVWARNRGALSRGCGWDVRWRIHREDGDPLRALEDGSAGAALALVLAYGSFRMGQGSAMPHIELDRLTVSAALTESGQLHAVAGARKKLEAARGLVAFAVAQTDLDDLERIADPRLRLARFDAQRLVLSSGTVDELARDIHELQTATVLQVAGRWSLLVGYLSSGNRLCVGAGLLAAALCWYLSESWAFVWGPLVGFAVAVVALRVLVRRKARAVGAVAASLDVAEPTSHWVDMISTQCETNRSYWVRAMLAALRRRLSSGPPREAALLQLPRLWWGHIVSIGVPVVFVLFVAALASPWQHRLAELLPPNTSPVFRGGTSSYSQYDARGPGTTRLWAAVTTRAQPNGPTLLEATISTSGWIELRVDHKPRTARVLRVNAGPDCTVSSTGEFDSSRRVIDVPIVDGRARFRYFLALDKLKIDMHIAVVADDGSNLQEGLLQCRRPRIEQTLRRRIP